MVKDTFLTYTWHGGRSTFQRGPMGPSPTWRIVGIAFPSQPLALHIR
jgi:hypothetical protein